MITASTASSPSTPTVMTIGLYQDGSASLTCHWTSGPMPTTDPIRAEKLSALVAAVAMRPIAPQHIPIPPITPMAMRAGFLPGR